MGDANTGRPSRSRYALCSCKSISTDVSARNTTAAQKNIESPRTILILRLTHLKRGSRSAISGEHRLAANNVRQAMCFCNEGAVWWELCDTKEIEHCVVVRRWTAR